MRYQKQLDKLGVTPGKLALIGVLAIVLVMVVVKQLPESANKTVCTAPTVASQQLAKAANVRPETSSTKPEDTYAEHELPTWPKIDLMETLASNPFAQPSWFVLEKRAAIDPHVEARELAELQEQGASIVVIAEGQKSARIGDQKYRIGDILEGYQVTDITTRGIILDKLDPR